MELHSTTEEATNEGPSPQTVKVISGRALTHATWPTTSDVEVQGEREYTGTLIRRAGKTRYEHDQAGRVVLRQRKQNSTKPLTWRYTWDSEDRLTAVTTPNGTRWRYRYDALGRRISKQRLRPDGVAVGEQVDFIWDGENLIEQIFDGHATTWEYAPGTFTPVGQIDQDENDQRFYAVITDLAGAPTELVTPGGRTVWKVQATLWGTTAHVSTDGVDCQLRFPGQYYDPETGDHYNNHRYYDPSTGRYRTPDPLGLLAASNPHAYVSNPTLEIDPFGLAPYSVSNRMRQAGPGDVFGLPGQGRIRYVPPRGYNPAVPLPRGPQGGYIDRFGNEWVVGPSHTPGHPFEWDVQLSHSGRAQIGWLSRDGNHVNISPLGEVTHR
jgi:RHS repeat-associated protein